MKVSPPLTVLMTVYNGMPYLKEAIDSILRQTYSDYLFLIIDDCSKDSSVDYIQSISDPRIKLIRNKINIGQTKSLNVGLNQIQSPLVARIDADDTSDSTRFQKQVNFLDTNPDVDMVGCNWNYIDIEGKVTGRGERPSSDVALRWTHFYTCSIGGNSVFRHEVVWNRLKGFNENITVAQDWELCGRLLRESKVANISEALYGLRIHPSQSSQVNRGLVQPQVVYIMQEAMIHLLGLSTKELLKPEWQSLLVQDLDWNERLKKISQLKKTFWSKYPEARTDESIRQDIEQRLNRLHDEAARSGSRWMQWKIFWNRWAGIC